MFGPENFNIPPNPVLGYLNPDDPEEKEMLDSIKAAQEEGRKRYPTPQSAAEDYRQGIWDIGYFQTFFSDDEVVELVAEAKKLNEEDPIE